MDLTGEITITYNLNKTLQKMHHSKFKIYGWPDFDRWNFLTVYSNASQSMEVCRHVRKIFVVLCMRTDSVHVLSSGYALPAFLSHQEITTNICFTCPEVKTPDVGLPL